MILGAIFDFEGLAPKPPLSSPESPLIEHAKMKSKFASILPSCVQAF